MILLSRESPYEISQALVSESNALGIILGSAVLDSRMDVRCISRIQVPHSLPALLILLSSR